MSFLNPSFEDTDNGTTPNDWTIVNERVVTGEQITIAGENFTSPTDTTYPDDLVATRNTAQGNDGYGFALNPNTAFDDAPLRPNDEYEMTSYLVGDWGTGDTMLDTGASDGDNALRLVSSSLRLYNENGEDYGYGVVRGPWIYSSEFTAASGQNFTFDWQAVGGSDDYDVFGFLLNVNDGTSQVVLDDTGDDTGGSWVNADVTVDQTSAYRFVFFSGSFDASGGLALGASLYLDNFAGSAVEVGAGGLIGEQAVDGSISVDQSSSDASSVLESADGTQYQFVAETATIEGSVIEVADTSNSLAGETTLTVAPTNKEFAFSGGAGNDIVSGGAFEDQILTGDGNDVITAGFGNDFIDAGNGNDYIIGGDGADTIIGGAGNDTIIVDGADVISGGSGSDIIVLASGIASYTSTATITDFSTVDPADSPLAEMDFITIEGAPELSVAQASIESSGAFGTFAGFSAAKQVAASQASEITVVGTADGQGSYVFVDQDLDGVFDAAIAVSGVAPDALDQNAFVF